MLADVPPQATGRQTVQTTQGHKERHILRTVTPSLFQRVEGPTIPPLIAHVPDVLPGPIKDGARPVEGGRRIEPGCQGLKRGILDLDQPVRGHEQVALNDKVTRCILYAQFRCHRDLLHGIRRQLGERDVHDLVADIVGQDLVRMAHVEARALLVRRCGQWRTDEQFGPLEQPPRRVLHGQTVAHPADIRRRGLILHVGTGCRDGQGCQQEREGG